MNSLSFEACRYFLVVITHKSSCILFWGNEVRCFINVSSSEGIPVSIMEVMSFGIPVIGTNVGGVSELVNQENGHLLSANPAAQEIVSVIEKFQQLSNEDKEKKSSLC